MLNARLEVSGTAAEIANLLVGHAEVVIGGVYAEPLTDGKHVRHCLHPVRVEALAPAASKDPAVIVSGALVRLFIHPPDA